MIRGIVHQNRPFISIIVGWRLGVQEIVALVDTGFTGELKIPQEKISELGLILTHTEPVRLADESLVNMPASLALVSIEGAVNMVNVLISKGMPVIGVGLLKRFGYALNINFKYDTLTLQK